MENEYGSTYANTLPEITGIATPVAKSTPVTQASHISVTQTMTEKDILAPVSSKKARAACLDQQVQDMSSVWLPLSIPLMKEESHTPTDLTTRINTYCKEQKERRQEWESLRKALNEMKQSKSKQPNKEEREIVYSQIAQNMEKMRNVV